MGYQYKMSEAYSNLRSATVMDGRDSGYLSSSAIGNRYQKGRSLSAILERDKEWVSRGLILAAFRLGRYAATIDPRQIVPIVELDNNLLSPPIAGCCCLHSRVRSPCVTLGCEHGPATAGRSHEEGPASHFAEEVVDQQPGLVEDPAHHMDGQFGGAAGVVAGGLV